MYFAHRSHSAPAYVQRSAFDAAVAVQGGELKQDFVFTPSTVGKFESPISSTQRVLGCLARTFTKAQIGKLCPETGAFVISATLGELEFELEENEVTLNLNKNVAAGDEWGIFLPVAAAAAEGAAGATEKEKAAAEAAQTEKAAAEVVQKEEGAAEVAAKEKAVSHGLRPADSAPQAAQKKKVVPIAAA
ncbi:hypothetical protein EK21DRAFT_84177 [Setomelanomma holmii]|uniref:Uncharacterized protein n=1 Tax=Setomelanomma holmii TaxID=210430 RepID=A0A9P4HJL9_9PLEO|nr:hypothetical protein EK21DRAFT_84177 [Setomelanomma holmii]